LPSCCARRWAPRSQRGAWPARRGARQRACCQSGCQPRCASGCTEEVITCSAALTLLPERCHGIASCRLQFLLHTCNALCCLRSPHAHLRQSRLQVRDVGVGSSSAKHASASAGFGDSPASPVSALSSAGSPCERSTSPCAATRSPPAAPGQGGPGSPFALADVADGCVAAGLQPRARSRSLLSDCMAEHDVRPRSPAWRCRTRSHWAPSAVCERLAGCHGRVHAGS